MTLMTRRSCGVPAAVALATVLGLIPATAAQEAALDRYPLMKQAMQSLQHAQRTLEEAPKGEWGGHRQKAIVAAREAQRAVREAVQHAEKEAQKARKR